jgi:hypothetical protein
MAYSRTIKKYTAKNAKTKKSRKIVKTGGAFSIKNWRNWFKRSKKIEQQPVLSQLQPQQPTQPTQPTIIESLQYINSKLFDGNGNVMENYKKIVRIKGYNSNKNAVVEVNVMETVADDLIILIIIKCINLYCFKIYMNLIKSLPKKENNTLADDYKNFNVDKMSYNNVTTIINTKFPTSNKKEQVKTAVYFIKSFNEIFLNINKKLSILNVDYNKNMIYIEEKKKIYYAKYINIYINKYLTNKNNIFNTNNFASRWIYDVSGLEYLKIDEIYEIFHKILDHKFIKYQDNGKKIYNYEVIINEMYDTIKDFCEMINNNQIQNMPA